MDPARRDVTLSSATAVLTGEEDSTYAGRSVDAHGDIARDGDPRSRHRCIAASVAKVIDGGIVSWCTDP
jgi:hypothetical protein